LKCPFFVQDKVISLLSFRKCGSYNQFYSLKQQGSWEQGFESYPEIFSQYLLIALTTVATVRIAKNPSQKSLCGWVSFGLSWHRALVGLMARSR